MDQAKIYSFCQRFCAINMQMEYRASELSKFGVNDGSHTCTYELKIPGNQLENLIHTIEGANVILEAHRKEEEQRNSCEAVQKAYDEYMLLLALVKESNELPT